MARRKGGRNKGFWYRANRGWYVTEGKRSVPLCDEDGHLKDRNYDPEKAYARYLLQEGPVQADGLTVERALRMYLTWLAKHGAPGTYTIRKRLLDDFCATYGTRKAAEITALDVQDWADAHPKWTSNRAPIQALRRAFNFCVLSARVLKINPVSGIKVDSVGKRVTYFSPEAEEAMYANAKPALATALRVCIRTGARPICEFGSLEARHVQETPRGQVWRFPKAETKMRRKERIIYVPEAIAAIVRDLIAKHRTGKLFRDSKGRPWTTDTLGAAFSRLKRKLIGLKVAIDHESVFYSCRHTFAKRMLGGFWGAQVSLEILAGLMGNTPAVCFSHYAAWSEKYVEPMWAAVAGVA
jgi:integrase